MYFFSFSYLTLQVPYKTRKLNAHWHNLMPSRDKTPMHSIDSECKTYALKECLLDLSQHHLRHQATSESKPLIQCQWSSAEVCLSNAQRA